MSEEGEEKARKIREIKFDDSEETGNTAEKSEETKKPSRKDEIVATEPRQVEGETEGSTPWDEPEDEQDTGSHGDDLSFLNLGEPPEKEFEDDSEDQEMKKKSFWGNVGIAILAALEPMAIFILLIILTCFLSERMAYLQTKHLSFLLNDHTTAIRLFTFISLFLLFFLIIRGGMGETIPFIGIKGIEGLYKSHVLSLRAGKRVGIVYLRLIIAVIACLASVFFLEPEKRVNRFFSYLQHYSSHILAKGKEIDERLIALRIAEAYFDLWRNYGFSEKRIKAVIRKVNKYHQIIEQQIKKCRQLRKERGVLYKIKGIIATESAGNPKAISPKGAKGLMQIMPSLARSICPGSDLFDPDQNLECGIHHLDYLLAKYRTFEDSLAYYNCSPLGNDLARSIARMMGSDNFDNFWYVQIGLPAETANYVPTVYAWSLMFEFNEEIGYIPKIEEAIKLIKKGEVEMRQNLEPKTSGPVSAFSQKFKLLKSYLFAFAADAE